MPELTEAELETWRDLIPDSVSGLYRFWQNYREE
jgi:uncharacterized protein